MEARFISGVDLDILLEAESAVWQGVGSETLGLMGTPVGLQPAPPIVMNWVTKKIGAVSSVDVSAVHDGSRIAFRLEWSDPNENIAVGDIDAFTDSAAILLPSVPKAPMPTMGATGLPVNGWLWRADENDQGRQVVAEGLGTTRTVDLEGVQGRGHWKGGRWRAVITRPLKMDTSDPVAQLAPGKTTGFGVAIWEGGNMERGGIKAYSIDWRELVLEAAARR
jgi:DMSO reductase family type II enzyme heme b subunit